MIRIGLEEIWSTLVPPTSRNGITGRRAPNLVSKQSAYLGLDGSGCRHFLVQVPDGTESIIQRDTRGLQVTTDRFQIGGNPEAQYVDLACFDSTQNATFSAVVQDLLSTLNETAGPAADAIRTALIRWKTFWRSRPAGLSREEALGLFGELWFLRRWLAPVDARKIGRWMGSTGARHDFQWADASVEVKTAATGSSDGPVHPITNIDQLDDPETGKLYLFSLQVVDDSLASNTLPLLVNSLTTEMDPELLGLFNEKLFGYGYDPVEEEAYKRNLRVINERLYEVKSDFPRITRRSFRPDLSVGVGAVSYTINMSACDSWQFSNSPANVPESFK